MLFQKGNKICLGRKHTEETKKKIGLKSKGRKHTEESKKKISEAGTGRIAWNKGLKGYRHSGSFKKGHPKYTINAGFKKGHTSWSKGKKGIYHSGSFKNGHIPWSKGKTGVYSEETRKKMSESRKGEKSSNWQGGKTLESFRIRNSIEFRLWREAVFARDNYTCQKCSERKGGSFNAHHIQNFAQYPELCFAIDNGITFCKDCHEKFHKIYGIKNNNKEQIKEFLKQR